MIAKLKTIFGEHGIPDKLYSDGGLVLKKAESTKMDPELALLCVRTTPISNEIGSPTELLYGRRVKVNLSLRMDGKEDIVLALNQRQEQQKFYYDRSSRDRSDLQVGQTVGLQDPKMLKWTPAKIIEKCEEPRAYIVKTPNGSCLRRNQRFLKDLSKPRIGQSPSVGQDIATLPISDSDESQTTETIKTPVELSPSQKSPKKSPVDKHVSFTEPVSTPKTRPSRIIRKPRRLIEEV